MRELFSAFIFDVTLTGIGVLAIPFFYKLWKSITQRQKLSRILWSSLVDFLFVFTWLFVGVASSMWVGFFASSRDMAIQATTAQIWQTLWIISGFILSISRRAATGALLGEITALILSIEAGGITGIVIGFLLGLWSNIDSHNLNEILFSALSVGVFMAIFLAFCSAIFIGTFITFGGATIGFIADAFGKVYMYEKLLHKFRIISHTMK